jgi:two-component system, response regulator / RNA-binding antiterminator
MKAMRVLLVDEDAERAVLLKSTLHESGYAVSLHIGTTANLLARVREVEPDVIIIDRESPDRDTLEHVCSVTRDQPRPIVLFTQDGDRATIQAAVRAGVSAYVVGGMSAERVRPILDVAMARFDEFQAMRQELDKAKTTLAERKQIERAKGIVMKSRGVSEDEAYGMLRKLAMERNQRIAQVSENVIAMAELLT